jgi:hypothetical protein
VPKFQHKPIKSPRKGSKRKEQKTTEGCPCLAHRTVRCTTGQCPVHQGDPLWTAQLRVFGEPLRYSSPECPVLHRTVQCAKRSNGRQRNGRVQRSADNATVRGQSAQSQSSARRRIGQWTVIVWCTTGLSGGPTCQSSNGQTLMVGWCGWRTGLSGAPIDSSPSQRPLWWLGL